jgi:Asp/Glu/hydantoin racemase
MSKNKKNTVKNAIDQQRKYDMDLLHSAGFDDVASAIAALDSTTLELRACENDYDALLRKKMQLEEKLKRANRLIIEQAHELSDAKVMLDPIED